jgi:replicative DNA helicase
MRTDQPCNIQAEKSVLGSILVNNDVIDDVLRVLGNDGSMFFHGPHGAIYDRMMRLHSSRKPVDVITLTEGHGTEDVDLILECTAAVTTSTYAAHHAAQVRDKSHLRALAETAAEIHGMAMKGVDAPGVMDHAQQAMGKIFQATDTSDPVHISKIIPRVLEHHREIVAGKRVAPGIMCGIGPLDKIIRGWKPGTLNIVAARTSVGKSAFALQCALFSADHGNAALVLSMEMGMDELAGRLLSQVGNFDISRILDGFNATYELRRMEEAGEKLSGMPILIDDSPRLTLFDVRSRARRHIQKHGHSLIIIDYLQLLRMSRGTRKGDRFTEVKDISNGLKELSRELKVPIIALSQLARSAEQERVLERKLAHMRESGDIEQDADVVVILSRVDPDEEKNLPKLHNKVLVQAGVAKHRNGPKGEADLLFDPIAQRFRGIDDIEPERPPQQFAAKHDPAERFDEWSAPQEPDDELPF